MTLTRNEKQGVLAKSFLAAEVPELNVIRELTTCHDTAWKQQSTVSQQRGSVESAGNRQDVRKNRKLLLGGGNCACDTPWHRLV
jgi:hypothetical protein